MPVPRALLERYLSEPSCHQEWLVIEFRVLGATDLRSDDGSVLTSLVAQPKRLALLAYLAVAHPARFHRRDKLLALFWPEADTGHARASLRKSLHGLRRMLGPQAVVTRGTSEVSLNHGVISSDVTAFREAFSAGRYQDALALYRGDLLDGVFVSDAPAFEEWVEGERAVLRIQAAGAWRRLLAQCMEATDLAGAAEAARRSLALQPDEPTLRQLMGVLTRMGDRAGALREYDEFSRRQSRDYGVGPATETIALTDAIRTDSRSGPLLAVLPFINVGDGGHQYLAEGLADQLALDLSRRARVRVIARNSITRFHRNGGTLRTLARDLGARYAVEGTLHVRESAHEVAARLIDLESETELWSDILRVASAQVFQIEEHLADGIVRTLHGPAVAPTRSTRPIEDPRAYDCYLRARYAMWRFNAEDLDRAAALLTHGLEVFGGNALLESALGTTYVWMVESGARADTGYLERAADCARKAMALDRFCAPAHVLAARVCRITGSSLQAVPHLKAALALNAQEPEALAWLAFIYGLTGREELAAPLIRTLLEIDPLSGQNFAAAGFVELVTGRFGDAISFYRRACQLEGHPASRFVLACALARSGEREAADQEFGELILARATNPAVQQLSRAYQAALQGDPAGVQGATTPELTAAARHVDHLSWELAACHALVGLAAEAVEWLQNAARLGFINYPFFSNRDPHLHSLRTDAGFTALMRRMEYQLAEFHP